MKLICTFILSCFVSVGFSQPEKKFVEALDSFGLARPQEKAYLQTDRSQYSAGETIWFKAYVTLFEQQSILSKLVYVTLSNAKGEVVEKRQYKLEKGMAAGELELPEALPAGEYAINAYTLWMLNFPAFIHGKKIKVYNTSNNPVAATTLPSQKIELKFFPEGGQMIEGLAGNVAFQALYASGLPANVSGNIIDSKGKNIVAFSTTHNGMGIVNFTPLAGETYTAQVTGQPLKVTLPAALKEGITISADNSNAGKTFIKLERGAQNKAAYNELLLVAQKNYEVVYMAKINFDEGMDAVAINKKNLAAGIMQVTVFTPAGVPLAERTVFVANYDIPSVALTTVGKNKREKNVFEVDLSAWQDPKAAVSVINYGTDNRLSTDNIFSGFLLSHDIKGYVHEPASYFRSKDAGTIQQLDLVMMVNGWSRYNWPDIMAGKYEPLLYPFETGLSVTGKVTHVNEKTALKAGKVNLIVKAEDSTTIMSEAVTDANSNFVISDLEYKRSASIFFQGTNQNKQNGLVSVKVNTAYFDSLKKINQAAPFPNEIKEVPPVVNAMIAEKQKKENNQAKLLQEVVVKTRKVSPADSISKLYASPVFEMSDQTLIMDNGNYFDLWQYLQRMVPGISVIKTDTGKFVSFDRYNGLNFFSGEPQNVQFFLNEVPVSVDQVDFLNPADVSMVKVYKGVMGIALGAERGAIAVYTNKNGSRPDWRTKGFDQVRKAGYSAAREFYSMNYSKVKPDAEIIDNRPTLLWQPDVKIVNGKAIIEFYNDDFSNQFKLTLEGMDSKGKLFSVEKIIE